MYVTRPLSLYHKFPDTLSLPPPEGPNSGILVVQDEESEAQATTCFGLCKDREIRSLPIPQNKAITIRHSSGAGDQNQVSYFHVMPIPVLNQPLSSGQYYITQAHGKHRGEAYTSSKEEDMGTCCFCTFIRDVKSRPLDGHDIYQQFQIFQCEPTCCGGSAGFYAKSVASDGFPPYFLRSRGWDVSTKTPKDYELGEAPGLNAALRARLPDFDSSPLSCINSETTAVGKWYCPFMFIKEGTLKDQSKKSPFYEMTLEQRWEQIFACEKKHGEGNAAKVDVVVQTEVALVAGREALHNEKNVVDGVTWFKYPDNVGGHTSVGLDSAIIERMRWEQERAGWIGGSYGQANVKRTEEFGGVGEWRKFGCYILVERFVLKRVDGSLVLSYDFKHIHQIKTKWE